MLKYSPLFISYLSIYIVFCNYFSCIYSDVTDWFTIEKTASFNFTVEPSVSVDSVPQFWTSTGLWYVLQFS